MELPRPWSCWFPAKLGERGEGFVMNGIASGIGGAICGWRICWNGIVYVGDVVTCGKNPPTPGEESDAAVVGAWLGVRPLRPAL